jgi:UDPglucose--hexose-1-phosphate uridylyltransferase
MSSMGVGYHDVVVTRDHEKNLTDLPPKKVFDIFDILRKRFLMLAEDDCIHYVSALHNWGPSAGASIYHPHYQIFALPIIPPDVHHSLEGSKKYFKKHRRCVHCEILAYEKGEKKRIIAENEHAVALAPYTSRRPFEVRIFPKKHFPFFEKTTDAELRGCALMLQSVLARIRKYLRDPDLNFYIHTGPLKSQKSYSHYHWHIEIIPNIPPPPAGFEMGTGIDINTVTPEKTAAILKGKA